jgi:hypothetical protein
VCFSASNIDLFAVGPDSACSSAAVTSPTGSLVMIDLTLGTSTSSHITESSTNAINSASTENGPLDADTLSSGAIGGIVGGVLGIAFLVCIAVILRLIKRQKKMTGESTNVENPSGGRTELGGRLDILGNSEQTEQSGRLRYPDA